MPERDPILLTPGPLTTSRMTRDAMLRDWGSWDAAFNRLTKSVCADLVRIAGGGDAYVCVPLQGSGTFAVEATLGTLVPRDARVLVPNNGAYCARIAAILRRLGIAHVELPFAEDEPASAHAIDAALARDARLTHVALVHLETSAGLLNPLDDIAAVCRARGRALIVDAMSSFGALPIALAASDIDALISASGKCLEGVPGMGFAIVRRSALEAAEGARRRSRSICTTSTHTCSARRNGASRRRRTCSPRCAPRSTSSSTKAGSRRAARATRGTARRSSTACARSASSRFSTRARRRA